MKELGQGGMGKVYQAEQVKIKRKVAIKVVHPHYAEDRDFVRRFHQEARSVPSLKHRNIVTSGLTSATGLTASYAMR